MSINNIYKITKFKVDRQIETDKWKDTDRLSEYNTADHGSA